MLATLLLLSWAAQAAPTEVRRLSWDQLGFAPSAPDSPAQGPEQMTVDPAGRVWLYDTVLHEILRVEGQAVTHSFPVRFASDLAAVEGGLLVLDGPARRLSLWTEDGDLLDAQDLPELVPVEVRLQVEGDEVLGLDLFGNAHPLAAVQGGALVPSPDGLQVRPPELVWDGRAMQSDAGAVELPGALRASGQLLGDWLVVDAVQGVAGEAGPLKVHRSAVYLPGGETWVLPVEGRLYAPQGDLARQPDGALLVLVPVPEGLEIWCLRP